MASLLEQGEVREWLNRTVSKTVVPPGTVGSNPTLSVMIESGLEKTK